MANTISFDLVSPVQILFKDKVGMIIVPGKDGDIGVLPGHSKLLSSLRPGRVMVYSEDKNLLNLFLLVTGLLKLTLKNASFWQKLLMKWVILIKILFRNRFKN